MCTYYSLMHKGRRMCNSVTLLLNNYTNYLFTVNPKRDKKGNFKFCWQLTMYIFACHEQLLTLSVQCTLQKQRCLLWVKTTKPHKFTQHAKAQYSKNKNEQKKTKQHTKQQKTKQKKPTKQNKYKHNSNLYILLYQNNTIPIPLPYHTIIIIKSMHNHPQ